MTGQPFDDVLDEFSLDKYKLDFINPFLFTCDLGINCFCSCFFQVKFGHWKIAVNQSLE